MLKNRFFLRNSIVVAICLAAVTLFSGCNNNTRKTNDDSNDTVEKYYSVKSAQLVLEKYDDGHLTQTDIIMWDDYGQKYRIGSSDKSYSVVDVTAGKGFALDNGEYVELSSTFVNAVITGRVGVKYPENNTSMPEYKELPNQIIAGKECKGHSFVSAGVTCTYAGWNGLLFLKEEKGLLNGTVSVDESYKVISYSETIPSGCFDKP